MRLALLGPVGLLAACAAPLRWHTELPRDGRPIYVLSLFGDLTRKC